MNLIFYVKSIVLSYIFSVLKVCLVLNCFLTEGKQMNKYSNDLKYRRIDMTALEFVKFLSLEWRST